MNNFKEVITTLLSDKGMSQADLAKEIETTPENVSITLSKRRGNPHINLLKEWLEVLEAELVIIDKNEKIHKL